MKSGRTLRLGLFAAILAFAGGSAARAQFAPAAGPKPPFPRYDIREAAGGPETVPGAAVRARYRGQQVTAARAPAVGALGRTVDQARAALAARTPDLHVERSRFHPAAEAVGAGSNRAFLTPASRLPHERTARTFLAQNAPLFGLTSAEVAGLVKSSDYANPAGDLSFVGLRQEINGIPVFQGEITAAFTPDGALARTTGNPAIALDPASLPAAPVLTPAQAAAVASAAIGRTVAVARLTQTATENAGRTSYLVGGPYTRATKTDLVYFPLEPGVAALAYSMVLWDKPSAYSVLVDATDGTLLRRQNITWYDANDVTYVVYTSDSPSPLSPAADSDPDSNFQPPAVSRVSVTLVADDTNASPLGWITPGANTTKGNNATAGLDIDGTDGVDANVTGSGARVFDFSYTPAPVASNPEAGDAPSLAAFRKGAVTNLFFWTNRYHDAVYNLGFTESAGNFQMVNTFGGVRRGGVAGDPISAEAQDSSGVNNANFSTGGDGSPGRMQMYLFTSPTPQRDGSLDAEVFLHELTHGLSIRLHSNGAGLFGDQSRGMGEGWSDFYALCLLSTSDPARNTVPSTVAGTVATAPTTGRDVAGFYPFGGYVTYRLGNSARNYYYGIRRFPYALMSVVGPNGKPHNPETFADVDPAQIDLSDGAFPPNPIFGAGSATEIHNMGEIWCSMLLEMRARLIRRLGYIAGNNRALQVVTNAMKLDVASPNMVQARDSIIAADDAAYNGEDVPDIRAAFALRGMGASASTDGTSVVESFSADLLLGPVTISDAPGNGNGVPEPGEDVLITVPLTNVGAAPEPAAAVTLGGYTATVSANAGAAVSVVIPYRVPASTPLGATLKVPYAVTGAHGGDTRTVSFVVGSPIYGFTETFDGVTPPALPAGWTTAAAAAPLGVAGPLWTTASTPTVDAGACASAADSAGNDTAGGESSLVSPALGIPAGGYPALSFKHGYSFEQSDGSNWDGGVLEISVAGGSFTDVLAAGGSFTQNGYNGTLYKQAANPLGGRAAFCGATAAPITTVVTLPASALGQSVQFRWRLGFDGSVGAGGWQVDTVRLITSYSAAAIDSDGDGLQDGYETAHGLNPNDPSDAASDADGDGQSALAEYEAGTDPQSAASALRISSSSRDESTGAVTVTFPSALGRLYTLEYKTDLAAAGPWTPLRTDIAGTGADVSVTEPSPDNDGQRFYRVRVQPL